MNSIILTLVGCGCHFPAAPLINLISELVAWLRRGLQHVMSHPEELQVAGGRRVSVLPWTMSLAVGRTIIPAHGPPLPFPSVSSLSFGRPSHPSSVNWVWYRNPCLMADACVRPAAMKTSMFSTTIMIIAAEHSAKGISKSD